MKDKSKISRRDFIKSATASVTATTAVFGDSDKEDKPLRQIPKKKNQTDTFKVAAVQMNAFPEKLEYNLEIHRRIAKQAVKEGCKIILFPELSATAHLGDESVTALAETATGGRIYKEMHSLAKETKTIICYGFCEIFRGAHYNSQALVSPDGLIGIHRKVHLSRDEYLFFRMGRTLDVYDLGFCKAGILTCYDASFFEAWRVLALKSAELLLLPHAGRSGPGVELPVKKQISGLKNTLENLPGRYGVYASDNNVFAVYCNQAGFNGHSTHSGAAYILGNDGKLISKSQAVLDDLWISAKIDKANQRQRRKSKNLTLKDRRPEMYGELTKMI